MNDHVDDEEKMITMNDDDNQNENKGKGMKAKQNKKNKSKTKQNETKWNEMQAGSRSYESFFLTRY